MAKSYKYVIKIVTDNCTLQFYYIVEFLFQVKRLAQLILEQKQKKETDEKNENEAIETRKKAEHQAKVSAKP